jgi:hypothetical protein
MVMLFPAAASHDYRYSRVSKQGNAPANKAESLTFLSPGDNRQFCDIVPTLPINAFKRGIQNGSACPPADRQPCLYTPLR